MAWWPNARPSAFDRFKSFVPHYKRLLFWGELPDVDEIKIFDLDGQPQNILAIFHKEDQAVKH